MQDEPIIQVKNLSKTFKLPHEKTTSIKSAVINFYKRKKTYELQKALNNVSFEVNKGDFFGVVGRNGSGKSTLLKILAGVYVPTSGEVRVNGKLTPFIELGVGFNPELTGRENVYLNGALLGFSRKEMAAMYDSIVEFAELEKFMDQKLKNYSSGMQVRLAFSVAIRAESDILLLDEVLAVGDAAFQQKCYDYFEELKRRNKTVVFVSHDMNALRRFCTKAVYINKGKLTYSGEPSEVADIYLEENMQSSRQSALDNSGLKLSEKYSFSAKLLTQTNEALKIQFAYKSEVKNDMYVGLSVIREGISIAEIITSPDKPLKNSGKVVFSLDTRFLNGGVYQIGAGLFKQTTRELLSISKNEIQFIVKGTDLRRGAAVKLADGWSYE